MPGSGRKKRAKRKLGKVRAKAFLATEQGQAWLARQIEKKNASRPDPGPTPEHLTRTKYPFDATINGRRAVVWPDRIEYPE